MQDLTDTSPTVSIIIATFNREKLLKEAIESVLVQTFSDYELLIIDDGSSDNTRDMIQSFDNPKIKYIYQKNKGRSVARNVGLNLAKGKYITFLDSDDLYLPNKLMMQVKHLDAHPHIGMIYTSAYCMDEDGNKLAHHYRATVSGSIYKKVAFFMPVTITLPTVMVRQKIIRQVGGFDEKMYRFEDTDMWRRLSKITNIHAIDEFSCKLRTHQDNQLLSQNPLEIIKALHYYANKILDEDKEIHWITKYRGIGILYHHYAIAFFRVPEWHQYGKELLQYAYRYWPLCKLSGLRYRLKDIYKKLISNLTLVSTKQEEL